MSRRSIDRMASGAAILGIAENLIVCNQHFRALAARLKAAGKETRQTRIAVALRSRDHIDPQLGDPDAGLGDVERVHGADGAQDLIEGGSDPAFPGYMTRGITDPSTYYYRRVFTDAVRAVEAARSHPAVDPGRVAVSGASR